MSNFGWVVIRCSLIFSFQRRFNLISIKKSIIGVWTEALHPLQVLYSIIFSNKKIPWFLLDYFQCRIFGNILAGIFLFFCVVNCIFRDSVV